MPGSTKGTKKCKASRFGATFSVFLVKGEAHLCKRARAIVNKPPFDIKNGSTSTGRRAAGPWSDVYYRHDRNVSIGAIMQEF